MADFDPDDYLDDEDATCPRCDGWGHIDCHCGGDLCVCDNYGDAPCPLCHGDGQVSEATYDKYQAAQRKWWAGYQAAVMSQRPKLPPPPSTTKRAKVKAARKQRNRK